MAWPLTGSALTKYNRLLSDLRQYGDFIFVGAPDDITWLQETIVAASDGALRPSLDDVANRSHYWMLELSRVLGEKVVEPTPCPECPPVVPCPPCPPCPPLTGIDWGPDDTTLDVSATGFLDLSSLARNVTSIILRNLETITGGDLYATASLILESFSAPELVSVGGTVSLDGNSVIESIGFPKLTAVTGDFAVAFQNLALVSLEFPALVTVGGDLDTADDSPSLVSVSYPVLTTVGATLILSDCPVLVSVSFPLLISTGEFFLALLPALQSLSLPNFTGSGGAAFTANTSGLVNVSMPVFLPVNGQNILFDTNTLSAASVNHILARCVANAGYVTGTVDTSGGTSSAPTGQGIADKATLIGRGVTVTTN